MNAGVMPVRSLAVTVARPPAEVFALLADIEAFARWAPEFCERIALAPRGWQALTIAGDWLAGIEADEPSGAIDLKLFDGGECRRVLPLRVVALPGGQTVVSAVLVHWPELDAAVFERECDAFGAALRRLGHTADSRRAVAV